MTQRIGTLTLLALLALVWPLAQRASAESRIDWDRAQSSLVVDLLTPDNASTRVALHHGRLSAFSPADATLFAVFLSREDVANLERRLRRRPDLAQAIASFGGQPAKWETIHLGTNGAVTVFADEAECQGSEVLVVVNGAGEILSKRPLWEAGREIAIDMP